MRATSSWATTEPRIGMAQASTVARMGTSAVAARCTRPASMASIAPDGPPSSTTTATSSTTSPTTSAPPWIRSVMASASSPPKVV